MTSPEKEFDYSHLEPSIKINNQYSIEFTLYDHTMCGARDLSFSTLGEKDKCTGTLNTVGAEMQHIYVADKVNKITMHLRLDNPCEDGRPSLLNDEVINILKKAIKNKKNMLTLEQMICCLSQVIWIDITLAETIKTEFKSPQILTNLLKLVLKFFRDFKELF